MSTNGIIREAIGDTEARRCLSRHSMEVVSLVRNTSGSWTITVDVAVDFMLSDGRRVEVRECILLRGKQKGRKPYKPRSPRV